MKKEYYLQLNLLIMTRGGSVIEPIKFNIVMANINTFRVLFSSFLLYITHISIELNTIPVTAINESIPPNTFNTGQLAKGRRS
jgi:hypothetical protein